MSAPEVFRLGGDRLVAFGEESVDTLLGYRQLDTGAFEAGGVLLGRIILATGDVVIDQVTTPCSNDLRSRYRFLRSRTGAQARVHQAWIDSQGTRIYLGEWHSHPEPHPSPSRQDIDDWRRVARKARYEQSFLLFVILGTQSLCVWCVERGSSRPTLLERR
ncbi:MAG: Mov34/MPN/PAD-1 family protein [Polyangiaceae bacterium]|nr:Mov34/MPN/PAD-1 family protein [Polyangiaceae bacterium]